MLAGLVVYLLPFWFKHMVPSYFLCFFSSYPLNDKIIYTYGHKAVLCDPEFSFNFPNVFGYCTHGFRGYLGLCVNNEGRGKRG